MIAFAIDQVCYWSQVSGVSLAGGQIYLNNIVIQNPGGLTILVKSDSAKRFLNSSFVNRHSLDPQFVADDGR